MPPSLIGNCFSGDCAVVLVTAPSHRFSSENQLVFLYSYGGLYFEVLSAGKQPSGSQQKKVSGRDTGQIFATL
jgi:hypothetical protein